MLIPHSSSGLVGYEDRATVWCPEEPNSSAFSYPYFERQTGQGIPLYSKVSRPPLGTTNPPMQWVLTARFVQTTNYFHPASRLKLVGPIPLFFQVHSKHA